MKRNWLEQSIAEDAPEPRTPNHRLEQSMAEDALAATQEAMSHNPQSREAISHNPQSRRAIGRVNYISRDTTRQWVEHAWAGLLPPHDGCQQLSGYLGTPSDAGAVSGEDEFDPDVSIPVICRTITGRPQQYTCDSTSSVGWLRMKVSEWLQQPRCCIKLVRGNRVLENDYLRMHDLLDGWEDSPWKNYIEVIVVLIVLPQLPDADG